MYCSIQEAWPEFKLDNKLISNNNLLSSAVHNKSTIYNNQYNQNNNIESRPELVNKLVYEENKKIETFKENSSKYNIKNQKIESEQSNCDIYIQHLNSCEECQMNLISKYRHNKLIEILTTNPQLKETLVVFLIGLLILIILNLFYK
jgi:hypothetical protein